MKKPELMHDPCLDCDSRKGCNPAGFAACPHFREVFVRAWDETTAWLREVLAP